MSKASQIIVLCEDKTHDVFVRRFLRTGWKLKPRNIRVPQYPNGDGSGKKFVQDNVAKEVKAHRSRQASTVLIIVVDADEEKVKQLADDFAKTCRNRDALQSPPESLALACTEFERIRPTLL